MATCTFCDQEMNGSSSCIEVPVQLKSGEFAPVRFDGGSTGAESTDGGDVVRCHDCDVVAGGFHHRGCDAEICPRCGAQLMWFRKVPAWSEGRWSGDHFCERVPVFTLRTIFDGAEIPLLVAHDAEGDWQVLDGESPDGKEKAVAFVSDVADVHPSLVDALDLPVGWEAWRETPDAPWHRAAL